MDEIKQLQQEVVEIKNMMLELMKNFNFFMESYNKTLPEIGEGFKLMDKKITEINDHLNSQ